MSLANKGTSSWFSLMQAPTASRINESSRGMHKSSGKPLHRGQDHGNSRLTNDDVYAIRERYATGEINQTALGKEYNVTRAAISLIITRKAWKHL